MKRLVFLSILVSVFSLGAQPLNIAAKGAVLINADSGAVLFAKKADEACFPASTTKVATLLYLLEKGVAFDAQVLIPKEAVAQIDAALKRKNPKQFPPHILEHDGSVIGLKAGEVWPCEALLYGMMLESGNDAANALAAFQAGSVERFMEGLNQFMQEELGLKKSHFCNPHGLHLDDHYTTPHELAKIAQAALKHPKFKEISASMQFTTELPEPKTFVQHNKLLKNGPLFYAKAICGKTGYHSKAGHTLVAIAEQEGRRLIAALVGYDDPSQRYKDAIALFEHAFKEKAVSRTLLTKQFDRFSCQLPKADRPLTAALAEDLQISYYPSEESRFHSSVQWEAPALPIEKGAVVGRIDILDGNEALLFSAPLFAEELVAKTFFARLADLCRHPYCLGGAFLLPLIGALVYVHRRQKRALHSSSDSSSGRA